MLLSRVSTLRSMVGLTFAAAGAALPSCSASTTTEPITNEQRAQLVAMETRKWDLIFGTKAQRDTAASWYDTTFLSVDETGSGIVRSTVTDIRAGMAVFPQLPPGTFTVSAMQVIEPGDGSLLLSYRVSGPGPSGGPWSAYAVSEWALRNGQWKTIFYQASPGAV
jgi:hypothetical protein